MKIRGNPTLDPSGFVLEGGAVGCLLIHGFTGSPLDVRPLGDFLHAKGLTVAAPLLPGHGATPAELDRVRWQDWAETVEEALGSQLAACEAVFIAGLSLGSLLTLHLAAQHPEVDGIAVYSPATKVANRLLCLLPIVRHFVKEWPKESEDRDDLTDPEARQRIWHYDVYPTNAANEVRKLQHVVRKELPRVIVPAIVFYSTLDTMIHPEAGNFTFQKLGSEDKELVTLHKSGHNMLVDSERESIFVRTYGFIVAHLGEKGGHSGS